MRKLLVERKFEKWIGVDFDGTLIVDESDNIPIIPMVELVKEWLDAGKEVRIFTARATTKTIDRKGTTLEQVKEFSLKHFGKILPITCEKDHMMSELWDDRAVAVEKNTGKQLSPSRH